MLSTVGQKRTFSFSKNKYEIKEIIENPQISMLWTWKTGICPHCKKKIEQTIKHDFYRIEILVDETKKQEEIIKDDIVLIGDTLDGKKLLISSDLYNQVFEKSSLFKNHIGG